MSSEYLKQVQYELAVGRAARSWHGRNGEPADTEEVRAHTMQAQTPRETFNVQAQRSVDLAYAIDSAHASGDPLAMLEAQMAQMPAEAQAEIRATLPFPAEEFRA